jgi:hypothetical protein
VTVWCHGEGRPRISGSCIARYLDPSKNIISPVVPQNEANCVIIVPDCCGTQFGKGGGQPMCLAQETHQLPETPIRTESSINLAN